jgi:hypothetical protein
MGRDGRVRGVVVAFVTAIAVMVFGDAGCASKVSGNGDETHFETCKVDADCRTDGGIGKHCVVGMCRPVIEDAGTGGRRGAGGGPGTSAGGGSSAGGSGVCKLIDVSSGDLDAAALKAILGDAAASCMLRASDYDRSCTKDTDCIAVGEGNACTAQCRVACPSAAINGGALAAYQADYDRTLLGSCPNFTCFCPERGFPRCAHGTCELSTPGDCTPGPAGASLSRDEYCQERDCPATLSEILGGYTCTAGKAATQCGGAIPCLLTVYEGCGTTVVVSPSGFNAVVFHEEFFDTATGALIGAEYGDDIQSGKCNSFGYYFGVAAHDHETTTVPLDCSSLKVSACGVAGDGGNVPDGG